MDTFVAGLVADHPGVSDPSERRCALLGGCTRRLDRKRPKGGELAACECDVDQVLCPVQLHSR
jgi:hypothetical protein